MKMPTDLQEFSSENVILKRIKRTEDSYELLEMMTNVDKQDLEPHQLSIAFQQLFKLHKYADGSIRPSQLTNHSGFDKMCHMMKFKAPRMEVNDLVASLKVLNYFGLKSESLLVQRILNLLKDQINELTPNQLLFLSFLLSKMNKTPLIEALEIAIPVVFDLNLSQKMDHNNVTELADLLYYMASTPMKFKPKNMTSVITALTLHGLNLNLKEARSVILSILAFRDFEPVYEKLFDNCMKIVNRNYMSMTFEEIEEILLKLNIKIHAGEDYFYNENFYNNCANFVVAQDVGNLKASYILKKFNSVTFVNYKLLDYIDRTIVDNHSLLSSSNAAGLMTFAVGFSNANYKSENWEIFKSLLHENPLLHNEKRNLPMIRFAVTMMALGFQSNILLEKIFNSEYLEESLNRDEYRANHIQLLLLWQTVKLLLPDYVGPLPEQRFIDEAILVNRSKLVYKGFLDILANILGGNEFIQTNVLSSHGHCLDFVVAFDNNENPIAMPCKINNFDELPTSQVKPVVVFFNTKRSCSMNYPQKLRATFDLQQRTIEALGIRTVNIFTDNLNKMSQNEKLDYTEREIRYALK